MLPGLTSCGGDYGCVGRVLKALEIGPQEQLQATIG